jgi:Transcriptional repressor TCF25
MLFYLDYLAVCAQAHDFLQRFVSEWDAGRSILLLPNWAFSLALVTFQHSQSAAGVQCAHRSDELVPI